MVKGIRYLVGFGVFAVVAAVMVVGIGSSSNARLMDMAERFDAIAVNESPSKTEMTGNYGIDRAHSYVGFRVTHMGLVDVPGNFKDFKGSIEFDANKVKNSTVEFTAKVKSVDTRVNGRDNHLRSKDFFEVEKYPEMSFKSTRVKKKGSKKFRVYGDLTLKGVTKPVMIPFRIYGPIKDQRGNIKMGIRGETTINRRAFNVNYGRNLPGGVPVISDNVKIDIQLETAKRKPKEKAAE